VAANLHGDPLRDTRPD